MDLISTINAITLFFKTHTLMLASYLGLSTASITVQLAVVIALSIVSLMVIGAVSFGLYKVCSSFKKSSQKENIPPEEIPSLEELQLPPATAGESLEYRAAIEALPPKQRGCMIAFEYYIPYKDILKKDNVSYEEFFEMVADAKQKTNIYKKY